MIQGSFGSRETSGVRGAGLRSLVARSLAALLFWPVLAAGQATSGVITGVVVDGQQAVLPGVVLTVRNAETGATRSTTTESDGRYRLAALPPGRYLLRAELSGFTPVEVTNITLTIDAELEHNMTMQLGTLQEVVTVTGAPPVIETTRAEVAGVITQQQIESLPLAARQPVGLALLMPGTSQDGVRPRKFNVNVGAGGFAHGSALIIDGIWNKDGNTGEPRMDLPQPAIREFKVFVSQAPAEYGWTAGGVISFETKSGTNLFSGEGYEFFRDKSLNTMNRFEQERHDLNGAPKPPYRRHQFGAAFGGPVVRDHLHFFVTAERTKTNTFATVTTGRSDLYSSVEGTFSLPEYSNMLSVRGDTQINAAQSAFGRYAWQQSDTSCETCGGRTALAAGSGLFQPRQSFVAGHSWVISSRVVNEVRGQATNIILRQHPVGVTPTKNLWDTSPARFAGLNAVYTFPSLTWGVNAVPFSLQAQREIRDDLSMALRSHVLKVGGGVLNSPHKQQLVPNLGAWSFSTDQPFDPAQVLAGTWRPVAGSVRQWTATIGAPLRYAPNVLWNGYAQDEWKVTSGLTLTLGLRYDYEAKVFGQDLDLNNKEIFPTTGTNLQIPFVDFSKRGDKNNFGPRLGLAWDLHGGQTVLRAGYGIYYNPMNVIIVSGERTNFRQQNVTIANPSYPDPYLGQNATAFISTAPQNITIASNNLENLESRAMTAGISQGLTDTMALHADVVHNPMTKMPLTVDINPRSGLTTGTRPVAQFARIDQVQSVGEMTYDALLLRLDRRFSNRYQYLVSYTLAKAEGTLPSSLPNVVRMTQAEAPELDRGPAATDRRHALVASGSVLLPYDVTLGAVWTLRSALPFSAIAGTDVNGDGVVTDYVPGTTRAMGGRNDDTRMVDAVNAWRVRNNLAPLATSQIDSSRFNAVDMRASKAWSVGGVRRFELIGQVFNLLGTDNLDESGRSNVALSNSFGRILQAFNRRQAEVAVRFAF